VSRKRRPARRETDHDGYVHRFSCILPLRGRHNDKAPFDPALVRYWLRSINTSADRACDLHLLYTRFFCKVMRDLGLVNHDEP